MKVAILAGGLGTRLLEETRDRPKPLVEIGGEPILWHVMRIFQHFGWSEFVIALGYKGDQVKRYFYDRAMIGGSLSVEPGRAAPIRVNDGPAPCWKVDLVETGLKTLTGGRIKRLQPHLGDETFLLTWSDGVGDIDLAGLVAFHRAHGKLATVTAVRPPARFGRLTMDGDAVLDFEEKPADSEGWINGAFFVLEPEVFSYIEGDSTMFEHEPLRALARDGQLMAYRHHGFWAAMDTLQDKVRLEEMWDAGVRPWAVWET